VKKTFSYVVVGVLVLICIIFTVNLNRGEAPPVNPPISTPSESITTLPNSIDVLIPNEDSISEFEASITLEHLKVDHTMLTDTFVGPSYVDEKQIAFEIIESNIESPSHIVVVNKTDKNWETVYTAPAKQIVDSLVGSEGTLFWVEHEYERQIDTPWKIKSLSLQTGATQEIRSGVAKDEISPPVLRIDNGLITWIEKRIKNQIVISSAYAYNPKDQIPMLIAEAELNEQNGRHGTFFILQRPIMDGILIHQSVFPENQELEKTFQIVHYPYNKTGPKVMANNVSQVDFTADSHYFVWTETGKVSVMDRDTGLIVHEVKDPDRDMSFDTPFIKNGILYYRYSIDSIFSLDLQTGIEREIIAKKSIYSKLFNSEGFLSFSYMPAIQPEDEVDFFMLKIDED